MDDWSNDWLEKRPEAAVVAPSVPSAPAAVDDFDLVEALDRLDVMRAEIGPAIDQMTALEKRIREHVLETGEKDDRITIRRGSTRYVVDTRRLVEFAETVPAVWAFIEERETPPSVAIRKL